MKAKCPYYYKLEEVFTSRAGIKASTTSDELFGAGGDFPSDDDSSEDEHEAGADNSGLAAQTPAKRRSHSNSQSKKSSSSKKAKNGKANDGDTFEAVMIALAKDTLTRHRSKESEASKIVALAEDFKKLSDALGSKIKAAYACSEFVQFLDKNEKRELKRYIAEQQQSSDEE